MKQSLTLLLSLCLLSAGAQTTIPSQYKDELSHLAFMIEMQWYDSAVQELDSFERTVPADEMEVKRMLYYLKSEAAHRSADCRTMVNHTLNGLRRHSDFVARDSFELSSAYNDIGLAYKCLGKLDSAAHYLELAIQTDSSDHYLYSNLAGVEYLQGSYEKALGSISRFTDSDNPAFPKAMVRKARILHALKRNEEARDLLAPLMVHQALISDPHSNRVMATIYFHLGQKDMACEHFKWARQNQTNAHFKTHPNNGDYLYQLLVTELMQAELNQKNACSTK